MAKFYHIYINPKKGITKEVIEKKLNLAIDWYRYDDKVYIVYSTSDVKKWQSRLIEFVKNGGQLFIVELNINNRSGWFNSDFWNWIKSDRGNNTLL